MFRKIREKIEAALGLKNNADNKIVSNIEIKDEIKQIVDVKPKDKEKFKDSNEQLKRRLRKIVRTTKTYRIRKKNIERLMNLFIK